ncbi:MAG: hypothetical protein ACERKV_02730 [Clostridiaceae bacterium]
MNREFCVFDPNKKCDNCGECERCDLDPNKICDNCGKCLQMEGYDTKAIRIDEIIDGEEEYKESNDEVLVKMEGEGDDYISESSVDFIDDIKDIKDILADEEKMKEMTHEEFPGLIVLNKR